MRRRNAVRKKRRSAKCAKRLQRPRRKLRQRKRRHVARVGRIAHSDRRVSIIIRPRCVPIFRTANSATRASTYIRRFPADLVCYATMHRVVILILKVVAFPHPTFHPPPRRVYSLRTPSRRHVNSASTVRDRIASSHIRLDEHNRLEENRSNRYPIKLYADLIHDASIRHAHSFTHPKVELCQQTRRVRHRQQNQNHQCQH